MKKFNSVGDIHFVTFRTFNNKNYFKDDKCCQLFLEELNFYRNKLSLKIYGYVIMPDHFHALIYFEDKNLTISNIVQRLKGATARRIIDLYTSLGSHEHLLLADNSRMEQMLHSTRRKRSNMEQKLRKENNNHNRGLKYRIWQPGFYDFNIYSNKKFQEKLDYIHTNPLKAGLVKDISLYKYCSWRNYELNDQAVFKIDFFEY
ncbi:MAG: hypothetical protein GF365_01635 [Candidatus Buchananbacteria bacterium]|nr:hypothetical protein [Candidatus Buchananbacteria bacterium]